MDEKAFRQQLADEGYDEVKSIEWAADTFIDTHAHDFSASVLVLSGEMTVTREDGASTCHAGDTCAVSAGTPHAEKVGPEGVHFLVGRK